METTPRKLYIVCRHPILKSEGFCTKAIRRGRSTLRGVRQRRNGRITQGAGGLYRQAVQLDHRRIGRRIESNGNSPAVAP